MNTIPNILILKKREKKFIQFLNVEENHCRGKKGLEMTDQLIHSQSRILMYCRCAEQYRRRYLKNDIRPPGAALLRGTGVHAGAAYNFEQKKSSHEDLKKQDIVDKAVAVFDERLAEEDCSLSPDEKSKGKGVVIGEERDRVWRLSVLQADDFAPSIQPVSVEERIIVDFASFGFQLQGTLDLKDDKGIIHDLKSSTKKRPKGSQHKDFQLSMYSALDYAFNKTMCSGLEIDVLVDKKTPELQRMTTERTTADFNTWFEIIKTVDAAIRAGIFPPCDRGSWGCSPQYCGYYSDCQFISSSERNRVLSKE